MIEAPLQTFHGAEISLEQKYHAYLTLNWHKSMICFIGIYTQMVNS